VKGYGSSHLLRWKMEKEEDTDKPTGRFYRSRISGKPYFAVPDEEKSTMHRRSIQRYLNNIDDTLEELKPILERISRNNAVVAMTANMGYMPMIMNFVCFARSRNIDLSNVLIFTTDKESADVIRQMGMNAFHTEKILGELPKEEGEFMDETFNIMTFAQIASVHMVNMLGYDILFQDADVIWYKDPLQYFLDDSNGVQSYDVLFMDDGSGQWDYQPWRANTGFYFVRNNERTRYLVSEFLFSGDVVGVYGNDQGVMSVLLNEHSAMHGLQVKTLNWYEFPGGRDYHFNVDFVNDVIDEKKEIWTWHMHWALNRELKVKYMEQSGWWYLNESCASKPLDELLQEEDIGDLTSHCCSVEPIVSCHFDDKPSVQLCRT